MCLLFLLMIAAPWSRSSSFGVLAGDSHSSEIKYYGNSLSGILLQYTEHVKVLNAARIDDPIDDLYFSIIRDSLMIRPVPVVVSSAGGNASSARSGRPAVSGGENADTSNNGRSDEMSECVVVDIYFFNSSSPEKHKKLLEKWGSTMTVCEENMCSACLQTDALVRVSQLEDVKWVEPAMARTASIRGSRKNRKVDTALGRNAEALEGNLRHLIGSVTSEGDAAMRTDVVRKRYGVDGSGVTIGVISDSFNCYGGAEEDIYSGDIPFDVRSPIPDSFFCFGNDEGRAMMQLIHDVAPGAELVFRSGIEGQVAFAQAIRNMATVDGVDIIVDDLLYFAEPMFQDGIIARAVDNVVRDYNVLYFSAAGNNGEQSYESAFRPVIDPEDGLIKHNFNRRGRKVDTRQVVRVQLTNNTYADIVLVLQWDQPFGDSRNDLDIVINVTEGTSDWVYVYSFGGSDENVGHSPMEILFASVYANDTFYDLDYVDLEIEIILKQGDPPSFIKWVNLGDSFTMVEHGTRSGTIYGHPNSANIFAVGAAQFNNTPVFGVSPPVKEEYSSKGGTPTFFDANGERLSVPEIRAQPRAVGPDGTETTFFYRLVDGKYYFFGTSAAAPHVAAVAALILEKDPSLSPAEVGAILEASADDMAPLARRTGVVEKKFDFETGFGFVNALEAFKLLRARNHHKPPSGGRPKRGRGNRPRKGMRKGMMMRKNARNSVRREVQ